MYTLKRTKLQFKIKFEEAPVPIAMVRSNTIINVYCRLLVHIKTMRKTYLLYIYYITMMQLNKIYTK